MLSSTISFSEVGSSEGFVLDSLPGYLIRLDFFAMATIIMAAAINAMATGAVKFGAGDGAVSDWVAVVLIASCWVNDRVCITVVVLYTRVDAGSTTVSWIL